MHYQPADTQWFSQCRFGIATHWTAQSAPVAGEPLDFATAVAAFDVDTFIDRVADTGAEYLLFTGTHALQKLPAPCRAIDAILPGRTTERDLIGELMRACQQRGLYFLLYYNHSCNTGDDRDWESAVGYHGEDKSIFADNLCRIVAELGERYGQQLSAWWFDSSYSIDPSGPANTVTTDMSNFQFPWEQFSASAKVGHYARLVTFNSGMHENERNHLYTSHQDYLAGEVNDLIDPPQARFGVHGLQEHRWVCLDNPNWNHIVWNTPLAAPRYNETEIAAYLQETVGHEVPVSFNLDIDQTGALNETSRDLLRSVVHSMNV
ncbi:MAG: alpha-L-fucosidase [Abditibacteriaceae bacterium]